MTPPTLAKAREILAAAAVNAGTVGNPTSPVVAAAIDVVFARLDHVEGLLAVHEKHLDAWASKPAHPAGSLVAAPSVRVPVVGDGDGPPIGSAQVGGGRAKISMAVDVAVPADRRPVEVRVGPISIGYAPSDAFVDRPPDAVALPPHGSWSPDQAGRSAVLNLTDYGQVISGSFSSTTALATIRNEAPSGEIRIVCLNGRTARLAPGDTAVLQQRSDGQFERVVQWMPAPPSPETAHGTTVQPEAPVVDKLPCPFCGRTDLLCVEARPESRFYCIRCRACGAIGPACGIHVGDPHGDREAAAHWNRRAAAPRTIPVHDGFGGPKIGEATVDGLAVLARITDNRAYAKLRAGTEAGSVSLGYSVDVAEVDPAPGAQRFEPVPDERLAEIAAGELLSARNALRYHEAHGRMRTNILSGEDTCIGCGKTAVLVRHEGGDAPWLCGDCERRAARPPPTGYRDAAGVYHPAPDTAEYPAHRVSCAACRVGEQRGAGPPYCASTRTDGQATVMCNLHRGHSGPHWSPAGTGHVW